MRALDKHEKRWVRNYLTVLKQFSQPQRMIGENVGYVKSRIKVDPAKLTYELSLLLIQEGLKIIEMQIASLRRSKRLATAREVVTYNAPFVAGKMALAGLVVLNYYTWIWGLEVGCLKNYSGSSSYIDGETRRSVADNTTVANNTAILPTERPYKMDCTTGKALASVGNAAFSLVILLAFIALFYFCVKVNRDCFNGFKNNKASAYNPDLSSNNINRLIQHLNKVIVRNDAKIIKLGAGSNLSDFSDKLTEVQTRIQEIKERIVVCIKKLTRPNPDLEAARQSEENAGLIRFYEDAIVTPTVLEGETQWQNLAADFLGLPPVADPEAVPYVVPQYTGGATSS